MSAGQVQYVLSDKTGTLTKNVMKLRRISLVGNKYGGPIAGRCVSDSKGREE